MSGCCNETIDGAPSGGGGGSTPCSTDIIIEFFRSVLINLGEFTLAEIDAGLIETLFSSAADLPSPPPTGPAAPAMAVVCSGDQLSLYYWNFISGGWVVSPPPWAVPFISPHWLIDQDNGIGAGSASWNFAMGPELQITTACEIQDLSLKVSNAGLDHAWAIRRSTAPGPSAPALATYTIIEASGVAVATPANVWTPIGIGAAIPGAVNDWFVCQIFPGTASGQSFNITTARANGDLDERLATLNAGTFVAVAGPNPGGTAPPTSRQPTIMYGVCSPFLSPL